MTANELRQQQAAEHLQKYILANHLRQTHERYEILKAVYNFEGVFTIEDLMKAMEDANFHVSKTTLYANITLFIEASLLIRHPYSSQGSLYERISDNEPRSYQICSHCHKITRIVGEDIREGIKSYKPRRFKITHRVLYVYGVCPTCQRKMKKTLKEQQK